MMPFPRAEKSEGAIGVAFEPRFGTDGTSLTSSSTMAEAITGLVLYMLKEGFSGCRVSIIRPDMSGKRIVVGTFLIGELPYPSLPSNTTRLDSAFS